MLNIENTSVKEDESTKIKERGGDAFPYPVAEEKPPHVEFQESLLNLYKNYKGALEKDRSFERGDTEKPVWGERVRGMTHRSMFDNAMKYLIEAEYLQSRVDKGEKLSAMNESELRGLNKQLEQFGPAGSESLESVKKMRETVRTVYDKDTRYNKDTLLDLYRRSVEVLN
jgi:hypothetical protein